MVWFLLVHFLEASFSSLFFCLIMSLFSSYLSIYVSCFWPFYKKPFLFLSSPTFCICLFSLGFDCLVFFNACLMLTFPYSWIFFSWGHYFLIPPHLVPFHNHTILCFSKTDLSCTSDAIFLTSLRLNPHSPLFSNLLFLFRFHFWFFLILIFYFCTDLIAPTMTFLRVEVTIIIISHSQKVRSIQSTALSHKCCLRFLQQRRSLISKKLEPATWTNISVLMVIHMILVPHINY